MIVCDNDCIFVMYLVSQDIITELNCKCKQMSLTDQISYFNPHVHIVF